MLHLKDNFRSVVTKVQEYQRYLILNKSFIRELEAEGCDTKDLKRDMAEMEAKIMELQMKCGYIQ